MARFLTFAVLVLAMVTLAMASGRYTTLKLTPKPTTTTPKPTTTTHKPAAKVEKVVNPHYYLHVSGNSCATQNMFLSCHPIDKIPKNVSVDKVISTSYQHANKKVVNIDLVKVQQLKKDSGASRF